MVFNTLLSSTFLFFNRHPITRVQSQVHYTPVWYCSNTFTSATERDLMIIKLSTDRKDFPRLFTSVSDQKCDDVKKKERSTLKRKILFRSIHMYRCIWCVKMFHMWLCWFVLNFMWSVTEYIHKCQPHWRWSSYLGYILQWASFYDITWMEVK